jgi:hypothetical protein
MISTGITGAFNPEKVVGPLGAFGLHTLAVYFLALEVSPGQ